MQPDSPSSGPGSYSPQPSGSISPDYGFLSQTPKRRLNLPGLPFRTNSLIGKIVVVVIGFIVLIIIISILKGLLSTSPFNKADYLTVLERQQEVLHILTTDVTSTNNTELSNSDLNFATTAQASLTVAQQKTLSLAASYNDKVNTTALSQIFSSSIDSGFSEAQTANDFDSYFQSTMQTQLSLYEQNLSAAYNSTTVSNGRSLLKAEYAEAQLLIKALSSPNS